MFCWGNVVMLTGLGRRAYNLWDAVWSLKKGERMELGCSLFIPLQRLTVGANLGSLWRTGIPVMLTPFTGEAWQGHIHAVNLYVCVNLVNSKVKLFSPLLFRDGFAVSSSYGLRMNVYTYSQMARFIVLAALLVLPASCLAQNRPRVSIVDRDEWQQTGTLVGSNGTVVAHEEGRVVHDHTELTKSLNKACPALTITLDEKSADYVIVWDHKTWQQTSWAGHQNEVAIYNRNKDLMASFAAHKMDAAARDICKSLVKRP